MNRFKFFVLTNCLFHICFLFTCPLPFMANIVGAIPIVGYSAILAFIVNETNNYKTVLFKSSLVFLILSSILSLISDMILIGIVLTIVGVVLALLLQPILLRYCRREPEDD